METLTRRGRPRNEELLAQRREEILAFASGVFARHGYQRADVQLIANGLGLGKGTIYRYFATKEELFLSTVDRGMARVSEKINNIAAREPDPIKRIATAIGVFLTAFDDDPEIVELLIQERAEFRDRETPTFRTNRERNIGPWHALLEELMTDGRVRPMPVEQITTIISNIIYGKLFTTYYNSQRKSFGSQANEIVQIVFAGILSDNERNNVDRYLTGDSLNGDKHAG